MHKVVIVGGGTAGWLTAAVLGAEFGQGVELTLVESPGKPPIGVGEGTWPSMRSTLQKIGLSETAFIRECEASFKQGTQFRDWVDGNGDIYYHPFTLPTGFSEVNLAEHWLAEGGQTPFAEAVTPQFHACEQGLAPKQIGVPEYAYTLNYGYHLDAVRFAALLQQHAVGQLGIRHVTDDVTAVVSAPDGDVKALKTAQHGELQGDLFVDCSGFKALLIGEHFGVPMRGQRQYLFNDRALAVQVPYATEDAPIAPTTRSVARPSGWVWDIGLQRRRGVGFVHAGDHCTEDTAHQELDRYVRATGHEPGIANLEVRQLRFDPGYREQFWHRNCVAIGLSAGFIEPLEASALVLVELGARALAERFPVNRQMMDVAARRFNDEFHSRWTQIIDFLKLHYLLSRREDSDYWKENRQPDSQPPTLRENLLLWQHQCPWHPDERRVDEMFPAASYQYVLYGMGFRTAPTGAFRRFWNNDCERARALFAQSRQLGEKYSRHLPQHRSLVQQLGERGFPQR